MEFDHLLSILLVPIGSIGLSYEKTGKVRKCMLKIALPIRTILGKNNILTLPLYLFSGLGMKFGFHKPGLSLPLIHYWPYQGGITN